MPILENTNPRATVTLPPVAGYKRGVKLVPGENTVSPLYMKELLRDRAEGEPDTAAVYRSWLRSGLIKAPDLDLREMTKAVPKTLRGHNLEEAMRAIGNMNEVSRLKKWRGESQRGAIHAVIDEKIATLSQEEGPPESLAGLRTGKAKPHILACVDADKLRLWRDGDTRTSVRKMIDERLAELTEAAEG